MAGLAIAALTFLYLPAASAVFDGGYPDKVLLPPQLDAVSPHTEIKNTNRSAAFLTIPAYRMLFALLLSVLPTIWIRKNFNITLWQSLLAAIALTYLFYLKTIFPWILLGHVIWIIDFLFIPKNAQGFDRTVSAAIVASIILCMVIGYIMRLSAHSDHVEARVVSPQLLIGTTQDRDNWIEGAKRRKYPVPETRAPSPGVPVSGQAQRSRDSDVEQFKKRWLLLEPIIGGKIETDQVHYVLAQNHWLLREPTVAARHLAAMSGHWKPGRKIDRKRIGYLAYELQPILTKQSLDRLDTIGEGRHWLQTLWVMKTALFSISASLIFAAALLGYIARRRSIKLGEYINKIQYDDSLKIAF